MGCGSGAPSTTDNVALTGTAISTTQTGSGGTSNSNATSNGLTKMFAATLPNSPCTVASKSQPGSTRTLYADDDGVVYAYYATVPTADQIPTLTCDENGKNVARPMQVQVDGSTPTLLPGVTHAVHRVRPALVGDPGAKSQKELMNAGYPLRPDPALSPDAYHHWLQIVSSPATEIEPKLVKSSRRHGTFNDTTSNLWAGWLLQSPVTYAWVEGLWTMPTTVSIANQATGDYYASPWTGLDGWYNGTLIQAGVDLDVFDYLVFPPSPWYEYYPDPTVYASNLPVSFGDQLFTEVASTDTSGALSPNGEIGWFYLHDEANGNYVRTSYPKPPYSGAYAGATAEWIIESGVAGSYPFTEYSDIYVTDLNAIDTNANYHMLATDDQLKVTMKDSINRVLTAANAFDDYTKIDFVWFNTL
jgi:hypothetical protein